MLVQPDNGLPLLLNLDFIVNTKPRNILAIFWLERWLFSWGKVHTNVHISENVIIAGIKVEEVVQYIRRHDYLICKQNFFRKPCFFFTFWNFGSITAFSLFGNSEVLLQIWNNVPNVRTTVRKNVIWLAPVSDHLSHLSLQLLFITKVGLSNWRLTTLAILSSVIIINLHECYKGNTYTFSVIPLTTIETIQLSIHSPNYTCMVFPSLTPSPKSTFNIPKMFIPLPDSSRRLLLSFLTPPPLEKKPPKQNPSQKNNNNVLTTPPPIRPGKTHRNSHPRRTKSLLRKWTHFLIISQFHRYSRRFSHRPPQFRRQRRPHIGRIIHAGCHGYDGLCLDYVSLAGEEYQDERTRGIWWSVGANGVGWCLACCCSGELCVEGYGDVERLGQSQNGGGVYSFVVGGFDRMGALGWGLYVPIPATELHIYQSSVIINGWIMELFLDLDISAAWRRASRDYPTCYKEYYSIQFKVEDWRLRRLLPNLSCHIKSSKTDMQDEKSDKNSLRFS